jgi:hypothetical protein
VANDYDGLRSGSLLGDELSPLDARAFLQERRDKRYDAAVIDACFTVLDARERGEGMVHELRLEPEALRPGMMLSRDLLSRDGVLLLTKGYRLTEALVRKINSFEQDDNTHALIHVLAEGEEHAPHHAGR